MRSVTFEEAVNAIQNDDTYRLSVYYGKNGKYSVDRGQMYGNVRETLLNILSRYPMYGLMMDQTTEQSIEQSQHLNVLAFLVCSIMSYLLCIMYQILDIIYQIVAQSHLLQMIKNINKEGVELN